MAFAGTAYHADSDADDEYERSVMTSPLLEHTDSENSPTDSEPPSNEHTPTTYGNGVDDSNLPRTIITEWTAEESAQFVASLGLRQYCEALIDNDIVGEALVALKHDELKEMGIVSVGHRLTILKAVYDTKVGQDIPVEPDNYIPLSAEQNPQHEMATKDDFQRLARSILRLRDDRIAHLEAQLTRVADDYRKLRQELLPVFKMAKESSDPLPHFPTPNPEMYQQSVTSPPVQSIPEKMGLTRSFSKKLFLGSSSTPKNNSPTHLPNTIHEGRTLTDNSSLDPSAAATVASNSLTASMSGGSLPGNSPSNISVPSPTSPAPWPPHQPLAPTSYRRDGGTQGYDGASDIPRNGPTPTPQSAREEPPNSGKSNSSNKMKHSDGGFSATSTAVNSAHNSLMPPSNSSTPAPPGDGAPSVEIFKSFRVGLEDPCWKVLPAALRKYNIQADWRQYALYIVYGDQERCVGLEEKPLALFKDLDREGKKPMFMLRKLAGGGEVGGSSGSGLKPGLSGGGIGTMSSAASVRTMQTGANLPGGVL